MKTIFKDAKLWQSASIFCVLVLIVIFAADWKLSGNTTHAQMLTLDGSAIVVCHGGVSVERHGGIGAADYTVTYPESDGTRTTVYGVHRVSLSTLRENQVPAECRPWGE